MWRTVWTTAMYSHPTLLDFSTSELFNNPCLSLQSYRESMLNVVLAMDWVYSIPVHKSRPKPPKRGWLKMRYLAESGGMGGSSDGWKEWAIGEWASELTPLLHTGTLRCQSVDQEQSSPNPGLPAPSSWTSEKLPLFKSPSRWQTC